jgi:hypothetical protein
MSKITRIILSLALLPTGAVLVLLVDPTNPTRTGELLSKLGLSLIITGAMAAFRELVILRFESEEVGESIAKKVHQRILKYPPNTAGIQLVTDVRRGYDGYYTWAIKRGPQKLFFTGRSVLHRIRQDFKLRQLEPVEKVIKRKLEEGSDIRILFMDPRSNIVDRLAAEEGQPPTAMLSDIAISIGVCKRLYDLLKGTTLNPQAQLHIRLYDEVPYFAYHREDDKVLVGFYFATAIGSSSSAFEILDDETQDRFEAHFNSICEKAASNALLEVSVQKGIPLFNEPLYNDLHSTLIQKLGKEAASQMIIGQCP